MCLFSIRPSPSPPPTPLEELSRAVSEGHAANEGWHQKKDGSRFWANAITTALKDETGVLRGFARMVRDFGDRHDRDEKLRRSLARVRRVPAGVDNCRVISGEYDHLPEANDTFLELVGYSREDLLAGRLVWPDLTPKEFLPLDELAHEEGLRFGLARPSKKSCSARTEPGFPYSSLRLSSNCLLFRWITFCTDLRRARSAGSRRRGARESTQDFEEIVGSSAPLKRMMGQVEVVAPTDANGS